MGGDLTELQRRGAYLRTEEFKATEEVCKS